MSHGYLTITRISGAPDELLAGYRRSAPTMMEVGRDHGLILHAAAKSEEGLLIVNLWPSQEGSESASRDRRRLGVIAEHGLEPGQVRPQHYEVADYVLFEESWGSASGCDASAPGSSSSFPTRRRGCGIRALITACIKGAGWGRLRHEH